MRQHASPLRWLWLTPGIILLIVGLAIGLSSRQINQASLYQRVTQTGTYDTFLGSLGNIYFHATGSPSYYVASKDSFEQPISTDLLYKTIRFTFVARTDTIAVNVEIQGQTITSAYPIEQLTLFTGSNNTPTSYITPAYAQYEANPLARTFQNQWPLGLTLLFIGLLADSLLLFFLLSRPRVQANSVAPVPQPYQAQSPLYAPPSIPPVQPGLPSYPAPPIYPTQPNYTAQPGYFPPPTYPAQPSYAVQPSLPANAPIQPTYPAPPAPYQPPPSGANGQASWVETPGTQPRQMRPQD